MSCSEIPAEPAGYIRKLKRVTLRWKQCRMADHYTLCPWGRGCKRRL